VAEYPSNGISEDELRADLNRDMGIFEEI